MDYAYEMEYHGTRMNTEHCREEVYRERLRPFYKIHPRVFAEGNQWCALYGDNIQEGVCGFGDTPEKAAIAFDLAWLNGSPNK